MENKPICITDKYGTKRWYLNGLYHREDGPAVEFLNGDKQWWSNDRRHRLDGPAIIESTGSKYWYINGKNVTKQITEWVIEQDIDLDNLTDEDTLLIKLKLLISD